MVRDEETVYRRIPHGTPNGNKFYSITNTTVKISSQAFTDREKCPSVDRAVLCDHDPSYSQISSDDGVVSFLCNQIRAIDNIKYAPGTAQEVVYKIDIIWRPIESNKAHSQIEPSPEYKNEKVFRRLRERLAYLANERGWEIFPVDLRS
jgi:hypothetical protein